jgi:hypothetical protein
VQEPGKEDIHTFYYKHGYVSYESYYKCSEVITVFELRDFNFFLGILLLDSLCRKLKCFSNVNWIIFNIIYWYQIKANLNRYFLSFQFIVLLYQTLVIQIERLKNEQLKERSGVYLEPQKKNFFFCTFQEGIGI